MNLGCRVLNQGAQATAKKHKCRTLKGKAYRLAETIIALARENGVVIDANPALAQALAGVEIDEPIPVELFEAVAEVIGFVLRARQRAT